jgi:TPR repeat protein
MVRRRVLVGLAMLWMGVLPGCGGTRDNRATPPTPQSYKGQKTGPEREEPGEVQRLGQAAEQGFALAQFDLGVVYAHSEGVPQNYTEAIQWYRRAAAQGEMRAQFNLRLLYSNGQGVPQDYAEAANL